MTLGTWILAGGYAAVMTILIRAGAAKLASPAILTAAIDELWPGRRLAPPLAWSRALAVSETLTAVLLAAPTGRRAALVLLMAFGLGFAGAGVLGLARGARKPCGCFGVGNHHPLGTVNVTIGCLFLSFAIFAMQVPAPEDGTGFAATTVLLAIIGSIVWLLSSTRRHIFSIPRAITGDR